MKKIYKYPLTTTDEQTINMPSEYEILCVQMQGGIPCLWAKVNPNSPTVGVTIFIFGTGNPMHPNAGKYIGTYQEHNYALVFHVFTTTP